MSLEQSARDDELRLRDELAMAFADQKTRYTEACFHPERDRPRVYDLELQVDAGGNETSRSLRTVAGAKPQPELDDCVAKLKAPPLKVPAPGKVSVSHINIAIP